MPMVNGKKYAYTAKGKAAAKKAKKKMTTRVSRRTTGARRRVRQEYS